MNTTSAAADLDKLKINLQDVCQLKQNTHFTARPVITEILATYWIRPVALTIKRVLHISDNFYIYWISTTFTRKYLDSLRQFSKRRSCRQMLHAHCVRCGVSPAHMASFTYCIVTQQNTTFLGLVHHGGGYDPKIETQPRSLCNASTPSFIILCLLVRKLPCWQTNAPTNKQIPAKTSNILRYATTLGNDYKWYVITIVKHICIFMTADYLYKQAETVLQCHFDLALHLQHEWDCNPCPSPQACLPPTPLLRWSHVHDPIIRDSYQLSCSDSMQAIDLHDRECDGQRVFAILNNRLNQNRR